MECLNCGAELHKNDIFCIKCETPVLTDDDLAALASMEPDGDSDVLQDSLSASDKLFSSLSLESDEGNEKQPEENGLQEKFIRKRNNNRNVIIVIATIVCAIIACFGIFFWLRSLGSSTPSGELPPVVSPPPADGEREPDPNNNTGETPPDVIYTVSAIAILSGGRLQTEFHVSVGESVILTSKLAPEGVVTDVIWSSSDTDVIEVMQTDLNGTEAIITGIAPGVADIIVTAGDVEESYVVFVDNLSFIMQFENALNNDETAIWLTISWTSDERFGQEIVFERDLENQLWTMESAVERGDVVPTFLNENGVITMRLPDNDNVYFLFDDSTGYFGNPGQPDNENFDWWFKTTLIEPEG